MNEKELEGAKKLIENKDVKKGSYSFIGNSNITYADIKILLDYIKQLEQEDQQLKEKLERSENARKEAIKYVKKTSGYDNPYNDTFLNTYAVDNLLEILDKGE